jgi:predicted nucleic acid-binding protein
VIAVDTNLLVYAHREDSPWHTAASSCITELAEGSASWAIPWPCVHEFISTVTNPSVFKTPTPLDLAFQQLDAWLASPKVALLGETEGYLERLRVLASSVESSGH